MPGFDSNRQSALARALKAEASRLGFDACGISEAKRLDDEAPRLDDWLKQGHHGTMRWMESHYEKRLDPRKLVEGARSVVSVLHNYYQPVEPATTPDVGRISRYAWGDDYHLVMKERLSELYLWLDQAVGGASGRAFVDSAPVMDKAWAQRAGLGWQGKHSNLIHPTMGSYFFVGELIVDVPLPADGPITDHCGTCTRCIDACPTDAIHEPYKVDAQRCIAYLTIEHRADDIEPPLREGLGNWIFGCDICQEVCPWNKFSRPSTEARYSPRPDVTDTKLTEWAELDLESYRIRFRKSPVKRPKFEGFQRNVRMASQNRDQS